MGSLAAHPWGAGSFARQFHATTDPAKDLLVLGAGKIAQHQAVSPVGYSIVHYRDVADGPCTFDVYVSNGKVKTMTITTPPFGNEWYLAVLTPAELSAIATTGPEGNGADLIELRVTSGILKVAAFVALTADIDLIHPEQITYVGSWLPREASRSGLDGYPTDALGAYAKVKCHGRRLRWIVSGNPGTKLADCYSGQETQIGFDAVGAYHIKKSPALLGPGSIHTIRCAVANASGSQANGHALHVGGAIVINDS